MLQHNSTHVNTTLLVQRRVMSNCVQELKSNVLDELALWHCWLDPLADIFSVMAG